MRGAVPSFPLLSLHAPTSGTTPLPQESLLSLKRKRKRKITHNGEFAWSSVPFLGNEGLFFVFLCWWDQRTFLPRLTRAFSPPFCYLHHQYRFPCVYVLFSWICCSTVESSVFNLLMLALPNMFHFLCAFLVFVSWQYRRIIFTCVSVIFLYLHNRNLISVWVFVFSD